MFSSGHELSIGNLVTVAKWTSMLVRYRQMAPVVHMIERTCSAKLADV